MSTRPSCRSSASLEDRMMLKVLPRALPLEANIARVVPASDCRQPCGPRLLPRRAHSRDKGERHERPDERLHWDVIRDARSPSYARICKAAFARCDVLQTAMATHRIWDRAFHPAGLLGRDNPR